MDSGSSELRNFGYKSSLGGRLLLAIVLIVGFPVATGVLGWFELQEVAANQSRVVTEAIPAISEVRGVAEETSRVVAVAPELAAVTVEAQRAERAAFLFDQANALRARLLRQEGLPDDALANALAAEAGLRQGLTAIDRLVRQRISLIARRDAQLRAGLDAAVELTEIADTLVANAEMGASAVISSLYGMDGTDTADPEKRLDTLDKLIEVDLFQMGLMFELRSHASEVGLLLNRVAGVQSQADLQSLRDELTARVRVIARRLDSVQDPRRADRVRVLLRVIGAAPAVPPETAALFENAAQVLAVTEQIAKAETELRAAALQLESSASALADRIEANAVTAGQSAQQAILATQRLYAFSAMLALVLSLAVLWFYVRGNLIRRLDALSSRMTGLAQGDLGLAILDPDDAVLVRLVLRHRRYRDVVAAVFVVGLDHLGEAGLGAMMQHVGQQQGERLVADDLAGAPHGVAEAERRLLAGEARLAGFGQVAGEQVELALLAARGERILEFELAVEMILDHALVAPRDEDHVLDAGGAGFVDDVLDHRPVDDGQHLLRHRLGRGKEPGAEAGHGEHGLANRPSGRRHCLISWGGRGSG